MAKDPGQLGFSFVAQPASRKVWTPRELVGALRTAIEQSFGDVWLQGEISNFRPPIQGTFTSQSRTMRRNYASSCSA